MKNKIIAIFLTLLLVATALPIAMTSAEYTDGFYYEINQGSATVTGYNGKSTELSVPDTLGGYPVTTVGADAFSGSLIKSITLPDSVTAVAPDSFSSVSIRNISVGEGNTAFKSEDGVLYTKDGTALVRYPAGKTSISFSMPSGLLKISDFAFKDVAAEVSIKISHSITEIGDNAFENASNITLNGLSSRLVTIGNNAFKGASKLTLNTIPASVRSIGNNAFENCTSLTIFTIHEGLETIGSEAFKGCTALRAVILPTTVNTIGQDAFLHTPSMTYFGCQPGNAAFSEVDDVLYSADGKTLIKYPEGKETESFTIPDTVEQVTNNAFAFTQKLLYLTSGSKLRSVTAGAFRDCTSILRINFPQTLAEIDVTTFNGCTALRFINVDYLNPRFISDGAGALYNKDFTTLLRLPEGYPSTGFSPAGTLKEIGNYAVRNCKMLQKINLPATVQNIGYGAFSGCVNLLSFTVPREVVTVQDYAFSGCTRLAELNLNEKIERIGSNSFYNCAALAKISTPASLKEIGVSAFENSGLLTVSLAEGVERISESAFASTAVTEAKIPASVKVIGEKVFYNCTELTAVNVDNGNENYLSDSGVLYTKDGKLKLYPMAKVADKYAVLENTTEISSLAFRGASGLATVKVPKSVIAISSDAFSGITESVTMQGYSDTAAQDFAAAHNITFVALDANKTDLFVSAVGPSKTDAIYEGDELFFSCTIRNIGDYDTADTLTVDFYANGRLIQSVSTDKVISAGRSIVLYTDIPFRSAFGNATVTAIVNSDENIPETDMSNNRMKKRFLIF